MKQKYILGILGLTLLILGVSAGTLLVQQNQNIGEKAAYEFPAANNCCGAGSSPLCLDKVANCGHTNVPGFVCQDGTQIENWMTDNCPVLKKAYVKCSLNSSTGGCAAKCVCGENPPNCNQCTGGGGGGSPPPGKKTPAPSGSPAACDGNKNPSTFTPNANGRLFAYPKTGAGVIDVALKKNASSCSLKDNDKLFRVSSNMGRVDTGIDITNQDKVCIFVGQAEDGNPAEGWKEAVDKKCSGGGDISDVITQIEKDGLAPVSQQCWGDYPNNPSSSCDYNDYALIFASSAEPIDNTVGIKLRFQGITKKAWNQKIKANFSKSGSTIWEEIDINVSNDETGVYTLPVESSVTAGTYDLRIKGHSHLQKLFSNLVYNGTGADLSASQDYEIRAGDVTDDNAITIEDVAQVSAYYTDLSIPVVEGNTKMIASDINKDGIITIQDLALIAINWSDLTVEGDNEEK